jgi:spore coat polysaccharide biosynthesis protein SpsF
MGSERLPGKVLLPLLNKPMLSWSVYRLRKSCMIDQLVVATSTLTRDNAIADWCASENVEIFRGSENDVLDRYYQAAQYFDADTIVRVTGDCPLIDPTLVDQAVSVFLGVWPRLDYLSLEAPAYPRGLDVEVMSRSALGKTWASTQPPEWREHVTYYIAQHPEIFLGYLLPNLTDFPDSDYRWTVDTSEDFRLVENIYRDFGHGDFSWQDVLVLLKEHPEWQDLNRNTHQKQI